MGRGRHPAVVVTVELIKEDVLVPYELHHPPEICLFLITAVYLKLPVAGKDQHRHREFTDVKDRGVLIRDHLQGANSHPFAYVVVGHLLGTVGESSRYSVRIDPVGFQPVFVEDYHVDKIASGGMAGHEYLIRVSTS